MSDIFQWADILSAAIPAGAKRLFAALAALVCIDYITGLCVAIKEKKVSSKIGTKGLASKVTIFAMAALGMVIDHLVSGGGSAICSLIILFYCSNELISICENANKMGLPLPKKLVGFLKDFHSKHNQS